MLFKNKSGREAKENRPGKAVEYNIWKGGKME
jgi:hypothetical protein